MSIEGMEAPECEPNDCADLVALLKRFGLKEVEAPDHGVPGFGTFWVEEFEDDEKQVTVGGGGEGHPGFFGIFTFRPDGSFQSHGFAE